MKKTIIACFLCLCISTIAFSQTINWRSLQQEKPNVLSLQIGYDFGLSTQVAYSRLLHTSRPILLGLYYSFPMGNDLFDDFKVRLSGQMELFEREGFSISTKIAVLGRRHQTTLFKITNFGAELALQMGYYRPSWHIAGVFGFDKAITSHLKHAEIMRDNHPHLKDGWYLPAGGHFFYGIQGSKSMGKTMAFTLHAGFTNAEGKDENAILPYYAQLGITKSF